MAELLTFPRGKEVNLSTRPHDFEDAQDDDAPTEHLRVVTPIAPKPRRIDFGDFIIFGGWCLALLFLGVLIGLLPFLLR